MTVPVVICNTPLKICDLTEGTSTLEITALSTSRVMGPRPLMRAPVQPGVSPSLSCRCCKTSLLMLSRELARPREMHIDSQIWANGLFSANCGKRVNARAEPVAQIWADGLCSANCGKRFNTRAEPVAQIWADGLCSTNLSRSCRTRIGLGAQIWAQHAPPDDRDTCEMLMQV